MKRFKETYEKGSLSYRSTFDVLKKSASCL